MKNHTVYFKLNGKTYKRYTDDNGRASLKITTKTYKNNLTISEMVDDIINLDNIKIHMYLCNKK